MRPQRRGAARRGGAAGRRGGSCVRWRQWRRLTCAYSSTLIATRPRCCPRPWPPGAPRRPRPRGAGRPRPDIILRRRGKRCRSVRINLSAQSAFICSSAARPRPALRVRASGWRGGSRAGIRGGLPWPCPRESFKISLSPVRAHAPGPVAPGGRLSHACCTSRREIWPTCAPTHSTAMRTAARRAGPRSSRSAAVDCDGAIAALIARTCDLAPRCPRHSHSNHQLGRMPHAPWRQGGAYRTPAAPPAVKFGQTAPQRTLRR